MGVAVPRPWWAVGVRDPLKSLVTGPSLLFNCYLGNKFHKKFRLDPPSSQENFGTPTSNVLGYNELNY